MSAGPVHGKPTTYSNHQCRCRPCRDAWAARVREQRARRTQAGHDQPETVPHGLNGYENYGCRCQVCTSARAVAQRASRSRQPSSS